MGPEFPLWHIRIGGISGALECGFDTGAQWAKDPHYVGQI